jgi:hypothetical protein
MFSEFKFFSAQDIRDAFFALIRVIRGQFELMLIDTS